MKKQDSIPTKYHKTMDNSTPFKVIDFWGEYELRLYWTLTAGTYGYQVISILFKNNSFIASHKTSSCGYCKESEAMATVYRFIGAIPKDANKHGRLSYSYHVGGNFYKVPKSHKRKFKA